MRTAVELPDEDYYVQQWHVHDGSVVQKGETIATARLKDGNSVGAAAGGSTAPASDADTATAVATTYKRPKKRPVRPTAALKTGKARTAAAATASKQKPGASANGGGTGVMNLRTLTRRIAARQASGDTESRTPQRPGNSRSVPTAIAVPSKDRASLDAAAPSSQHPAKAKAVPILSKADGTFRKSASASGVTVGYVEPCSHPGYELGLCIVCGKPEKEENQSILAALQQSANSGDDTPSTVGADADGNARRRGDESSDFTQVTVSGGVTMTVSKTEAQRIAQESWQRMWKARKLNLVLDLDHTLVHATADPRAAEFNSSVDDCRSLVLPVNEGMPEEVKLRQGQHNVQWMRHFVKLRPYVKEFLQAVEPMYEITIYTAGTRQYAEEIAMILCRKIVGSPNDQVDLDQLRFEAHRAELEWKKCVDLTSSGADASVDADKKRKRDDADDDPDVQIDNNDKDSMQVDDQVSHQTKKKKKVSFGLPPSSSTNDASASEKLGTNRSDHITEEKLKKIRSKLDAAEKLEAKAKTLKRQLFGSRIVSRTDVGDLGRDVKSLRRIFPCGGALAAVVDDREDVWANANDNDDDGSARKGEPPDNLLLVRPYHWKPFLGFADVNNASGADLSEGLPNSVASNADDQEIDVQLQWTAVTLKRLHEGYYKPANRARRRTAPELLNMMRREVLAGCTIVLSGLIPRPAQQQYYEDGDSSRRARPPYIRYAENLGAALVENIGPDVTHVVVAKDGSDKAITARKLKQCALVKPSWLMDSYWSCSHRNELDYLLSQAADEDSARVAVRRQQEAAERFDKLAKNPSIGGGDNEGDNGVEGDAGSNDDDEDDDFAADLEEEMMADM